ncbi:porin family protein [Hymenobacter terrenus]|uniref:hypothetical protein n=1 Tax=Hymenobacter terrenus TaxID=1629124 RepID=UPI00061928AD|nr:hypothetical protein [Hymenobacter terrenus]
MKKLVTAAVLCLTAAHAHAQTESRPQKQLPYGNTFTLGAKLVQPILLGGFNLNGVYYAKNRLTLEYSHGGFLKYPSSLSNSEQKAQGATIKVPWTTGFGVGYRLAPTLDIRMEVKAHRYNVTFADTKAEAKYTTYTLGPGIYYRRYLGKKTGLNVELSTRYWYDVATSLKDDKFTFTDNRDVTKTHEAVKMGLSYNLGIGYTFGRNK